jgi:uncharacterized membrane protein
VTTLAWIGAVLLWLVLSYGSVGTEAGESGAYNLGRVMGAAAFSLAVGLVIRFVYVKARRGNAPPFWSPWIFVIAAGVALVALLSNAGERARDESAGAKREALVLMAVPR